MSQHPADTLCMHLPKSFFSQISNTDSQLPSSVHLPKNLSQGFHPHSRISEGPRDLKNPLPMSSLLVLSSAGFEKLSFYNEKRAIFQQYSGFSLIIPCHQSSNISYITRCIILWKIENLMELKHMQNFFSEYAK